MGLERRGSIDDGGKRFRVRNGSRAEAEEEPRVS